MDGYCVPELESYLISSEVKRSGVELHSLRVIMRFVVDILDIS